MSVELLEFATDGMLGKLTRWLRMLGHDVKYFEALDDRQLIRAAMSEHRILLTRDLGLSQQALSHEAEVFLVKGETEVERLAELARRFDLQLEIDMTASRCPKCNAQIKSISKDKIFKRIPHRTALHYQEFWICLNCEQIYWRGAHWKRIDESLSAARELRDSDPKRPTSSGST
jgi:uncharacterized protein with PIN domain